MSNGPGGKNVFLAPLLPILAVTLPAHGALLAHYSFDKDFTDDSGQEVKAMTWLFQAGLRTSRPKTAIFGLGGHLLPSGTSSVQVFFLRPLPLDHHHPVI